MSEGDAYVSKRLLFRRMLKSKFFMIGLLVVLGILVVAIFAPQIVLFDPLKNSLFERLQKPDWFSKGMAGHIFGTDELGRDVFTRLLTGAQISLIIAAAVTSIQIILGTVLGVVSGYIGGWVDVLIMRVCDIFLALPSMLVAIALMAVLGASIPNLILILSITGWVQFCRVTRNNVKIIRSMEFVSAEKVMGASRFRIMFKQILPNVTTDILVLASQRFGYTISTEATLSFLSLGVAEPMPSWGNMIASGRDFLSTCPWLIFAPGLALMVTVLAFNFLGDGLRDVLDPKRL